MDSNVTHIIIGLPIRDLLKFLDEIRPYCCNCFVDYAARNSNFHFRKNGVPEIRPIVDLQSLFFIEWMTVECFRFEIPADVRLLERTEKKSNEWLN